MVGSYKNLNLYTVIIKMGKIVFLEILLLLLIGDYYGQLILF